MFKQVFTPMNKKIFDHFKTTIDEDDNEELKSESVAKEELLKDKLDVS